MVAVIWGTWLKAGAEAEGLRLSRQIRSDMRSLDGYVSHELHVDEDAPRHVIAVANWRSRRHANGAREKYQHSPTIVLPTPLLAQPRSRWVTRADESA